MANDEAENALFAQVERAVLQIGWLGQRQFMHLLADERFDLTVPQFYSLLHLSRYNGGCNMSDLARATHQSAASLTGVIDRLLEKGLVARERADGDRRQVWVGVTERGEQLLLEVQQMRGQRMRQALASMSASEVSAFLHMLDTVCSLMERQLQTGSE